MAIKSERSNELVFKNKTILILTREDILECAQEMGIPIEAITDDVLDKVKDGVGWGLECWSEVMKEAINTALKGYTGKPINLKGLIMFRN